MKRVKKIICTIKGILFIVIVAGSIGYAIIAPTIEEPVLTTEEFVAQKKAEMVELHNRCVISLELIAMTMTVNIIITMTRWTKNKENEWLKGGEQYEKMAI